MDREKIYSLDSTITKRLGKKANRIWYEAKKDLEIIEIIRNHISYNVKHEYKEMKPQNPYNFNFTYYIEYYRKKMDEETMNQIILWLKENISKERLKELFEDE